MKKQISRSRNISSIKNLHRQIKNQIEKRLEEFRELQHGKDTRAIFKEFAFCLLTPQSKAEKAWKAVTSLEKNGLLFSGNTGVISNHLKDVRYRNKKAVWIVEARKAFFGDDKAGVKRIIEKSTDPFALRRWLVENFKGMGYKEASHFIRNVGITEEVAILDRHILRSLVQIGVINQIPAHLTKKQYLTIEAKMKKLSHQIKIPMSHLDFLFWYRQTGRVFK